MYLDARQRNAVYCMNQFLGAFTYTVFVTAIKPSGPAGVAFGLCQTPDGEHQGRFAEMEPEYEVDFPSSGLAPQSASVLTHSAVRGLE